MAQDPQASFSAPDAATAAGVTYRQLDYWARAHGVRPSVGDAAGSGSRRRYSPSDVVRLRAIGDMVSAGLELEVAVRATANVSNHSLSDLRERYLAFEGEGTAAGLYTFSELRNAFAGSARAFKVLGLRELVAGVERSIGARNATQRGIDR